MTDVTVNPLATPEPGPTRDATGTLTQPTLQPSESTPKDLSTPAETSTEKTPTPPSQKEPTPSAKDPSLLNQKPAGAPEKYTDFKLPEGLKLEPTALTEAQTLFKGLNLSQDQAQSLVDFHAKAIADATSAPYKAVTDMKSAWETEVRSAYGKDIEPGGKVNVSIARLIDSLGPELAPGFREAMDHTLAGSNPAFVKAFAKLAEMFSEGTTVKGNGPSPLGQKGPDVKPLSIAAAMYPHLPSAGR